MAKTYTVKPGDTLNSIAQANGYSDYKAAGITAPSGNPDLIKPGEVITFNGSSNTGVSTFKPSPAIITSQDSAQQFSQSSSELDGIVNAPKMEDDPVTPSTGEKDKNGKYIPSATGNVNYDNYRNSTNAIKEQSEKEAEDVLGEYDQLYKTELAAIDARTKASIASTKQTFEKRINEQKRINNVNIDRVKAYGLAYGAAQYNPLEWSDAITEREREAADEITSLERDRQNAIDAAKAAKNEGDAALLAQKIKDYNSVKDKLNTRLEQIEKDSEAQYKLLRELRKEQEAEFKEKQQDALLRLQAYYKMNKDEVEGLSDDEKEALVTSLATKYGFEPYEVLSVVEQAVLPDFDTLKSQAEIDRIKAQTTASQASAGASSASAAANWSLAAKRDKETELLGTEEDDSTYTQTELNKLRQAGLSDATTEEKDNFLYNDGELPEGDGGTIDENDPEGLGI